MRLQNTFCVATGTLFSIFSIPFSSMWSAFILAGIGAIGAYLFTILCKKIHSWIIKKIQYWLKS